MEWWLSPLIYQFHFQPIVATLKPEAAPLELETTAWFPLLRCEFWGFHFPEVINFNSPSYKLFTWCFCRSHLISILIQMRGGWHGLIWVENLFFGISSNYLETYRPLCRHRSPPCRGIKIDCHKRRLKGIEIRGLAANFETTFLLFINRGPSWDRPFGCDL